MKTDLILINPEKMNKTGLFTMASCIRKQGFNVKIFDGTLKHIKKCLIKEYKKNFVPLVGITCMSVNANSAYELCRFIKKRISSKVLCAVGGFHASALMEKIFEESNFDYVIYGEGEITMHELVERITRGNVPTDVEGTLCRIDGKIIRNKPRELIQNLDTIPWPAYDLVNFFDYIIEVRRGKRRYSRGTIIMLERGCMFDCVFCSSKLIWQKRIRRHSVKYSIDFIKWVVKKYDLNSFIILDDEFFGNHKWVEEFCNEFIKQGLKKKIKGWECMGRVTLVTPSLLSKLKEAGCFSIRFGMESGSEKSLKYFKKGSAKVKDNLKAIKMCKDAGIQSLGTFLIGAPDETMDDILDTIDFIETSGVDQAEIFIVTPLPATDIWETATKRNFLKENLKWSELFFQNAPTSAILRNSNFTAEQLFNIRNYIHHKVIMPHDHGKKPLKLNHRKEIEKILQGDTTNCYFSLRQNIYRYIMMGKEAIRYPRKLYKFVKLKILYGNKPHGIHT